MKHEMQTMRSDPIIFYVNWNWDGMEQEGSEYGKDKIEQSIAISAVICEYCVVKSF